MCPLNYSLAYHEKHDKIHTILFVKVFLCLRNDVFFTMMFPYGDMANHSDYPSVKVTNNIR